MSGNRGGNKVFLVVFAVKTKTCRLFFGSQLLEVHDPGPDATDQLVADRGYVVKSGNRLRVAVVMEAIANILCWQLLMNEMATAIAHTHDGSVIDEDMFLTR